MLLVAAATALVQSPAWAQSTTSPSDFQLRTLLIVDPSVVHDPMLTNDPCGSPSALRPWGFGTLMQHMAPTDQSAVDFIKDWLGKFMAQQTVNGDTVLARDISEVWSTWRDEHWDLKRVPFRLIAIVNRLDLLRSPLLAGENSGEVRFVFGAVKRAGGKCTFLRFSVILEYGVRHSSCDGLQGWARKWVDLGGLPPSDPKYKAALVKLIQPVIDRDRLRAKPNGSAIDHVRSNESLAKSNDFELREFRPNPANGLLMMDTVTMTPRADLADKTQLADFLASIKPSIDADDYWIPLRFPSPSDAPLLGGAAHQGTQWTGPGNFAMNTCSGCHSGSGVTHIDPVDGKLSSFLVHELGDKTSGREGFLRSVASSGCTADAMKVTGQRRLVH